ncbi:MAG TPA: transferase, partial [Phycisphaerales bacterium]|nr:transferase [Phycisphaerales bacterium]
MSQHSGPLRPQRVLAIIPARGGSKGVPRKNVMLIAGQPLVAHMIQIASHASLVDDIIVSTDDPEISAVSKRYGAEVVQRPVELSGDTSSSESALLHVLDHLKQQQRPLPDVLVFLQCTAPLTTSDDIDQTISLMNDEDADSAMVVVPFHYFLWKKDSQGQAIGINHDKTVRLMRQQRQIEYLEAGSVYVMKTDGFCQHKHRFFGKTVMHPVSPQNHGEIDDLVDFMVMETRLRARQQKVQLALLPHPTRALILDFDGVMTDNRVILDANGQEMAICDRSDGMGIEMLKRTSLPIVVISKEKYPIAAARCQKLDIECYTGIDDKP